MDSLERGQELLRIKIGQLPILAACYKAELIKEQMYCLEVVLTAFCWYAENEENVKPTNDVLYKFNHDDEFCIRIKERAHDRFQRFHKL